MKIANYTSKSTGTVSAIVLCEGDNGDLIFLPKQDAIETPCLLIADWETKNGYREGRWTNIGQVGMTALSASSNEVVGYGCQLPKEYVKEYQLYLKLKKRFEG